MYISIYRFQNLSKSSSFVSMASHYFLCQKNHSIKHFNKYNEFVTIWYALWCWVFGTSKVQYVMVIQNIFIKIIQCDHITCNIFFLNHFHILLIYFVPWPIIDNLISYDMIMYSTLVCFHLECSPPNRLQGLFLCLESKRNPTSSEHDTFFWVRLTLCWMTI